MDHPSPRIIALVNSAIRDFRLRLNELEAWSNNALGATSLLPSDQAGIIQIII